MRTIATIEARMASSRLPGKILMEICGKPVLQHIVERLKRSRALDDVVVATTTNPLDDATEALCRKIGCSVFRGSEPDVLERLIGAAREHRADVVVQATGDCPLIDPALVDRCVELYRASGADFVSNRLSRTYPAGLDVSALSPAALERTAELTADPVDREHGTFFIYTHPEAFSLKNFASRSIRCPEKRWLLDYREDFAFMTAVYEALHPRNPAFDMYDVLRLLDARPEIEALNAMHPVQVIEYPEAPR